MNDKFSSTYIYKIETYNDSCERLIKLPVGLFGQGKKRFSIKRDKDDRIDDEKLHSSVSRSKRNIRRLCLANDFEYFATWTISSQFADRFSVQDVQDRMRKLLKAYQRINNDFKYIYVIEKHKDGALHFHGMVKGVGQDFFKYKKDDFEKLPHYILDTIEKGISIYHCIFFDNKLGYNTFTKIKNYTACCNYIVKYISKNPIRNENDQVYFCSRGLIKCIDEQFRTYINEKYFDKSYKYTYKIMNDYGEIEERLLCEVVDIDKERFNQDTKIDYYLCTTDKQYSF